MRIVLAVDKTGSDGQLRIFDGQSMEAVSS